MSADYSRFEPYSDRIVKAKSKNKADKPYEREWQGPERASVKIEPEYV